MLLWLSENSVALCRSDPTTKEQLDCCKKKKKNFVAPELYSAHNGSFETNRTYHSMGCGYTFSDSPQLRRICAGTTNLVQYNPGRRTDMFLSCSIISLFKCRVPKLFDVPVFFTSGPGCVATVPDTVFACDERNATRSSSIRRHFNLSPSSMSGNLLIYFISILHCYRVASFGGTYRLHCVQWILSMVNTDLYGTLGANLHDLAAGNRTPLTWWRTDFAVGNGPCMDITQRLLRPQQGKDAGHRITGSTSGSHQYVNILPLQGIGMMTSTLTSSSQYSSFATAAKLVTIKKATSTKYGKRDSKRVFRTFVSKV